MKALLLAADNVHQDTLAQALRVRGHAVTRCEPARALDAVAANPPDLVIVDLALPGLDGPEFCRRLRALPQGAWCVLLVLPAGCCPQHLEAALRCRADDYLLPQDEGELLDLRLAIAESRLHDKASRRHMMNALVQSESRFRHLLETAPDAILQIDAEGVVRLMNQQAEKLCGYRREELLGQPVELLIPEQYRDLHVAQRRAFFERPATRPMGSGLNLSLRRKDGSELPVDICIGFHHEAGQPYAIAAVRDITDRRQMENELRLAKEVAERAYERIRRDMELAAHVQQALLPTSLPAPERVRFAWRYRPCAELAGDGLNVFWLDEDHIGLYLLDVSGHGVAAALLSVSLARQLSPGSGERTLLRVPRSGKRGYRLRRPAAVARRLNTWFLANPTADQFFTLVYGILDIRTHRFAYVSAGHTGVLQVSEGGALTEWPASGPPIGVLEDGDYHGEKRQLAPGDRLFLYSDGIIDAFNPEGQSFGPDRLRQCILRNREETLDSAVGNVLQEVLTWSAGQPHDDLSVLALAVE